MKSQREEHQHPRRGLPWQLGSCLALALLFLGCGDPYVSPLMASTAPPSVRVRLGGTRTSGVLDVARQSWHVRSVSGRAFGTSGVSELKTRITYSSGGIRFDGRQTGSQLLVLKPARTFVLDGLTYAGVLRIAVKRGKLEFVNELDMETYVAGVIGNEVGPGAAPATYRAQAVAARTYAWMKISAKGASERAFHLFDNSSSQVYKGMSPSYGIPYPQMVRQTKATAGVVLMWQSRPFRAYYSSTCGGHTTDHKTSRLDPGHAGSVLQGVPCRWCKSSKYYAWPSHVVTSAKFIANMKRIKQPVTAPIHSIRVTERGRGDWVRTAEVTYGPKRRTKRLSGPEFRTALGVRSHNVAKIQPIAGGFKISGKGWGHGVGMCQWGAIEMGRAGASESEILRYYYPGIELRRVY